MSAAVDGKEFEAKASLDWKPSLVVALVDHIGDSEFVLSREKIALVLANVDQPKIFFNGRPVRPEEFGNNARLFTFQPEWTAGRNRLTAEGKGPDGSPVSKSFTFVYLADGNLKQGETVLLQYGYPGSRSGPFFNVSIKGDAAAIINDRETG